MKKLYPLSRLFSAFVLVILFTGCFKDKITRTYTVMSPVYESKSTVLARVESSTPIELGSPGKIFIKGRYLFINELNKGVHVIDNSNPSSPIPVSFIPIPGNIDIASQGNYLYADMFTDLLTIDISDPLNAKLEDVTANVFPQRFYGNGFVRNDSSWVIVDWITKDTTVTANVGFRTDACRGCLVMDFASNSGSKAAFVPGIGGSMARFTIVNDYLYTVNNTSLGVFNIDNPGAPLQKNNISIGLNIETIYPFENRLFIGSSAGMFIFNIHEPSAPEREGAFSHATACDPVVADGSYAFVTLRSGNNCQGNSDQLDVIDISDVLSPQLIKTYSLSNPHGLGKDGDLLFVCDGSDGLKIYDASNVENLEMIKHIGGLNAYDVIPWNGRLIVIGAAGLYQFDYSNRNNIKQISTIKASGK